MIKVKLSKPNLIKVRLLPPQGINVDLKTTYLYDPDWIPAINNAITDAHNYAESAKESEQNAAQSASDADADATNAAESATIAYNSEQKAIAQANKAIEEANAAAESAYQAQTSALASYEYASNAEADAQNALETLEHVLTSLDEVKKIEQNAKTSEQNAKTSEQNAKTSETNAKASESKAAEEANASAESAYQSQQSALAAYEYASNADADAQNVNETLDLVLESEQICRASTSTSNANAIMAESMKNQATQQANIAAQQANIATEKADEASQFVLECQAIKDSLGNVYVFKGSVATFDDLPTDAEVGDVYDVIDSGVNYAWTGSEWDSLGASVDLSLYATKEELSAVEDELDLYAKKEYISDFRGNWKNYTSVPENSNSYPLDEYNSRIPTFNDYLIVKDASDYFVSSSKNLLEADVEAINVSNTPADSVLVNFNAWYMGVAYNGYMGRSVPIDSFSSDKGKISFESSSSASFGVCKFVRLSPNTTYTLSSKSGGKCAITGMSDEGDGYYKFSTFIKTPASLPLTFTTKEQSVVSIVFYASSDQEEVVYDEIQLEVGSFATIYEVAGGYYLNGTWRFRYSGEWDANGKSGWTPEYEVGYDLSDYATKEYVDTTEQEIIENYMQADTDLQTQITGLSTALTTAQGNITTINSKIPTSASSSNLLITNTELTNATQDVRSDFADADTALQTQITGQATVLAETQDDVMANMTEIADLKTAKQDKLTAGENITIENNVISAIGGSADITDKITNCITEIPQDIKLELSDGNMTLKAGSKVYVPNGFEADGTTPKFDEVVIESDCSFTGVSTQNGKYVFAFELDNNNIGWHLYSNTGSGTSTSSTNGFYYRIDLNKIHYKNNTSGAIYSLPIGFVNISSGEITSIDQVFNGVGYIGSTVFALSGIKALLPNGRNEDETLRNIEVTTDTVRTLYTGAYTNVDMVVGITQSGLTFAETYFVQDETPSKTYSIWYSPKANKTYQSSSTTTFKEVPMCICAKVDRNAGLFSNLRTKTTFHAVDYNDAVLNNGDQDIAGNKNFTGTLTWNGKSHTSWSMPSGSFTNLTTNDGATYFTAPNDGWYCIRLSAGTNAYNLYCINTTTGVGTCMVPAGGEAYASCPVKKGDAVKIFRKGTVDYCRFVYAYGTS